VLAGRAWSGNGLVERVEVAGDGVWADATLGPANGNFAWRGWSFDWDATKGQHELACRATDATQDVQPLEPPWNYQGMGNNVVQRIPVTVR
jgi:Mo-co oxidoreductase dimerisation domain